MTSEFWLVQEHDWEYLWLIIASLVDQRLDLVTFAVALLTISESEWQIALMTEASAM